MKAVSIITIIYGTLAIIYSLFSLLAIWLQQIFLQLIPYEDIQILEFDIFGLIAAVQHVLLIIMPFLLICGILYIVAGSRLMKAVENAVMLVRIAAWLNIILYIGYTIEIQLALHSFFEYQHLFPAELFLVISVFGSVLGAVFACGYPVFLLIYLRNKK